MTFWDSCWPKLILMLTKDGQSQWASPTCSDFGRHRFQCFPSARSRDFSVNGAPCPVDWGHGSFQESMKDKILRSMQTMQKKNSTQIAIQLHHQNISSFGLSRDPERVWFTYWFRVSKFKRCLLRAMNIMNYETSKPTASEFSSSETSSPGRTPKASWQNVRQLLALQTVARVARVPRVLLVALFTRKLNEDEWGVIKWHSWS